MGRRMHKRSYMEVLETILQTCPTTKTTLYIRSGLDYSTFRGPRYFQLLLKRGLIRQETNHADLYTTYRNVEAYLITSKGERYLQLIAEAKEILGLS